MKRYITFLLLALMVTSIGMASERHDDDDKTTGKQREVRRLHPERERAKAIKKLQEQMSRNAEPKADPWDTSDEVWGTVDLPPATSKDSNAVEGRRLPSTINGLSTANVADADFSRDGNQRLTWRDEPVTTPIDQLLPFFSLDGDECRSKYVTTDEPSNEVYFAFSIIGDSISSPLRLCVRYCADQPLNYDQIIFTIDGYDYPFYPLEPQYTTLDNGLYLECSDDVLRTAHKDLIYALAHGHWVAAKLVNPRGIQRVKILTDGQREDFAHTLDLYRLLGGGF